MQRKSIGNHQQSYGFHFLFLNVSDDNFYWHHRSPHAWARLGKVVYNLYIDIYWTRRLEYIPYNVGMIAFKHTAT